MNLFFLSAFYSPLRNAFCLAMKLFGKKKRKKSEISEPVLVSHTKFEAPREFTENTNLAPQNLYEEHHKKPSPLSTLKFSKQLKKTFSKRKGPEYLGVNTVR